MRDDLEELSADGLIL